MNKSKYAIAKAAYEAGDYEEAKNEFERLGEYSDSKNYAALSSLCSSGMDKETAEKIAQLKVGDTITFGNYEGHTSWCVIDRKGSKALLISKDNVEKRIFDKNTNKWDKSDIRKWLNNTYINKAFNKKESSRIINVEGDKVFLLSTDEYGKYKNQITNAVSLWWLRSPGKSSNIAAYVSTTGDVYLDVFPGFSGSVYVDGTDARSGLGVRPAIWINLEP